MFANNTKTNASGPKALYQKEDIWAVWIGLLVIVAAIALWAAGLNTDYLVVKFDSYESFSETPFLFVSMLPKIVAMFAVLALVFGVAAEVMGHNSREFLKGFALLFVIAVIIEMLGSWTVSQAFNMETPLLALIIGMIIGNFIRIPAWFDAAMRTEFFVKVGIVLMGATLPFSMIVGASPVAFLQATLVSVVTFGCIYYFGAHVFKLEKPFAATLAAGGSICGVSASIAVGSSVNARKSHVSMCITMVVVWATVMMFLLPILVRGLGIPNGVAGAWIGSSEYADAAGIAAAARFGDDALATFTLVKVLGRDLFVGVWSFVMAIIAVTVWESKQGSGPVGGGQKPSPRVIWERFPKFVIGFLVASIIVSLVSLLLGDQSGTIVDGGIIAPIKSMRDWAFILCFLCIGMTTRVKDLAATGWKPVAAFSCGVVVNLVFGFFVSSVVLGGYWASI